MTRARTVLLRDTHVRAGDTHATRRSAVRMTIVHPEVRIAAVGLVRVTGRHPDRGWERSRVEWRVGDAGDPADVCASFLERSRCSVCPSARVSSRSVQRLTAPICGARRCSSRPPRRAVMRGRPRSGVSTPASRPCRTSVRGRQRALLPDAVRPAAVVPAPAWRLGTVAPSWTPGRARGRGERGPGGDRPRRRVPGERRRPRQRAVPRRPAAGAAAGHRAAGRAATRACSPATAGRWPAPRRRRCCGCAAVGWRRCPSRAPGRPPRPGRAELLASAKERAEHIMIVDLERNDLARVARVGTVEVPQLFAVRRWCDLWQAESRVTADAGRRGGPGRAAARDAARAARSPARPSWPRWRRSPPWSRSGAGRAWARWAGSTTTASTSA